MKTLIIHHFELEWELGIRGNYSDKRCSEYWNRDYVRDYHFPRFSMLEIAEELAEYIQNENFEQVILTKFNGDHLEDIHQPLTPYISKIFEYGYGWSEEDTKNYKEDFIAGGIHSEKVMITDWMRNLPKEDVYICGGFDRCCLDDLETALRYLRIKYNRVENFIV